MMRTLRGMVWMAALASAMAWVTAAETPGKKLKVVATTTHVADLVRQIAGDKVELDGLMGPGVDPHLYKPTASDLVALNRADVILYNGLHLEGRMTEVLEKMGKKGTTVVAVAEAVPEARLLSSEGEGKVHDPHVWFDPTLWQHAAKAVAEALAGKDPANAAHYRKRAEEYAARLGELAKWGKQELGKIPADRRVLVTSHDAFEYFGRAFGMKVIGVQGISTVTEAGLADITKTVDLVKANKVRAIFVESSVSPANIRRISADSGAKIGGELYSDALGAPGEKKTVAGQTFDVGTYEGMFRHNVLTVAEGLR